MEARSWLPFSESEGKPKLAAQVGFSSILWLFIRLVKNYDSAGMQHLQELMIKNRQCSISKGFHQQGQKILQLQLPIIAIFIRK